MPILPFKWGLRRILLNVAGGYAALKIFHEQCYEIQPTSGPSMFPTLDIRGEAVLVSKFYKYGKSIQVGDMVVIRHPFFLHSHAGKRVVGMPGDFVLKNAPFKDGVGKGEDLMIQVPEGHVWLTGDNLPWSRDSREYGPVPLGLVIGKVVARAWPLSKIGWFLNTMEPAQFSDD
ncbi:hypothetical protein AJ80_08393 [Polytolypa hystricis UAMH7299]|uniref:Peptidase S26 domain-containing protein n=1 Tax=Polytolypa hystricis (strain UAMH7299) TaxID=1447883 RepID=A0A2B7X8W5_POLH7|nr:hypothetical protein AJ80_08393 [Polytolypa hystricis UAMH7299]